MLIEDVVVVLFFWGVLVCFVCLFCGFVCLSCFFLFSFSYVVFVFVFDSFHKFY